MIISREDVNEEIKKKILDGAVFIYPTDTIYGIGCDARNSSSVKRIRDIKEREDKPFSVIAPSKDWIKENCIGDFDRLPGAYTLILKLKKKCVCEEVNNGLDTLGVRIPECWFSEIVKDLNIPIVTTSVNKTGEKFMTCLDDLDKDIKVDFVIYDGELNDKPSKLVIDGKVIER